MTFSVHALSVLVLVALGGTVLAMVFAIFSAGGNRRRSRVPGDPLRLDDALRAVLEGHAGQIKRLETAVRSLHTTDQRQQEMLRGGIRRVALMRYDAFEDVGGRLSFSCALLDDHGSGVVLTSINGRQETRVYAKPVTEGRSRYNLSSEEEETLRQALAAPEEAVKVQ